MVVIQITRDVCTGLLQMERQVESVAHGCHNVPVAYCIDGCIVYSAM